MKRFNILALEEDDIQVDAGGDADVDTDSIIEQGQQAEVEVVSDIATLEEHMEAVTNALEVQQEISDQVAKNEEMLENVSQVTPESVAVAQEEFYKSLSKLGQIPSLINISRELAEPLPLTRLRLTVEDQKGIIGTIIEKIKAFLKAIKDFFVKIFQKLGIIRKSQEVRHENSIKRLDNNIKKLNNDSKESKSPFVKKENNFSIPLQEVPVIIDKFINALGGYIMVFNSWSDVFETLVGLDTKWLATSRLLPKDLPYEASFARAAKDHNKGILEVAKSNLERGVFDDRTLLERIRSGNKELMHKTNIFVNFNYIYCVIVTLNQYNASGISYDVHKIENRELFQEATKIKLNSSQDCLKELDKAIIFLKRGDAYKILNERKNKTLKFIDSDINKKLMDMKDKVEKYDNAVSSYYRYDQARDLVVTKKMSEDDKWILDVYSQLLKANKTFYSEYVKHCASNSELELLTRVYNVLSYIIEKYGTR